MSGAWGQTGSLQVCRLRLTTAELGLLEAAQGLGMQGAGIGTECMVGQLQGVIPGPGQQPAEVAVTGQELRAKVSAEWIEESWS